MNLNFLVTSLTLALTDAYYLRGNKEKGTFQSSELLPPHQCLFFTDYCDRNPHQDGIPIMARCDNASNARVTYPSLTNNTVFATLTFEGEEEMNPCTDPSMSYDGSLWFSGEDPRREQIVTFKPELVTPKG